MSTHYKQNTNTFNLYLEISYLFKITTFVVFESQFSCEHLLSHVNKGINYYYYYIKRCQCRFKSKINLGKVFVLKVVKYCVDKIHFTHYIKKKLLNLTQKFHFLSNSEKHISFFYNYLVCITIYVYFADLTIRISK